MSSRKLSRRKILELAVAAPALAAMTQIFEGQNPSSAAFGRSSVINSSSRVVPVVEGTNVDSIKLIRRWAGRMCKSELVNRGRQPVRIKEVVLFDLRPNLPPATQLYGEGFQMLSQTGGTFGEPADLGNYTDAKHYRISAPAGARAFYGMMMLSPSPVQQHLLAFTSCRRFIGQFYLRGESLQVVVDTEGLEIEPGASVALEEFTFETGSDRELLLERLATRLVSNHPPLRFSKPPTGWCSWYCFGPRVTAQQVLDNLDFIAKHSPGLRYIQIDDGYQPAMGDWLETGAAFGGNVQGVLKQIRERGFEPAIWVAPFVAEEKSNVFQQHSEWFVKDVQGKPLRSDLVTFGGWRRGPWYVLDGTHPEVQKHFEHFFGVMRREWGCTYFKLDANFWGAIHGGRFHDPHATRIEAYRRGMQAVLRGTRDGFVLGCNHPIWPSFGLIHGSRSSNDIKRTWERIETTARQNLSRNWQNDRLWWNDPDAVVLSGDLPVNEFQFHATAIYATGGMLLSGDDLTKIDATKLEMLRKLQPPTGVAARFEDDSFQVGRIRNGSRQTVCVLNWSDTPQSISFSLDRPRRITDFWNDSLLGTHSTFEVKNMAARSGRIFVCEGREVS
ncbi:MAG TPA: glycoside hydrolase family 36 protein [Pyrinomonadaceae bacterium]|nr:glycoside hydrolase family 36 protein [Pyrinomonadaceae bacterium]